MHIVAKRTTPSLVLFVHMDVVEISVAIPKPGGK